MDTIKPLFSISATAVGGRNGHVEARDQSLKVDLSLPKQMGGAGKPDTVTPEHLFAMGYAACFCGALDFVAKKHKKDASNAKVTCDVSIGKRDAGGLALAVKMHVEDSNLSQSDLEAFVKEAHEDICPYSHATRGNISVEFDVKGGQ